MRGFSLIVAALLCASSAAAQEGGAWSGTAAQGVIEGFVTSSDGKAQLGAGCSLNQADDKSGLSIFLDKVSAEGHVSIRVDDAEPMEFDLVQGAVAPDASGRDALFEAMIAGSSAEVALEDGQTFAFSLARSGIYLKPCL